MNRMRKCNDEVYQLAKDQALVKKLKNKKFRPFCLCLSANRKQEFDGSKIASHNMAYLYEACDQKSDFFHQQLLRKM